MLNRTAPSVCASVGIQLSQELALTRNTFRATLEITNAPESTTLKNVHATIEIWDERRIAFADQFGVGTPELTGINDISGSGELAPGATGRAVWELTPSPSAAPTGPVRYLVGGELHYMQEGVQVVVPLFPATIVVAPDPNLVLHYFLQRNIYGDDPFTEVIEPAEPFTLGLLVVNESFGVAQDVRVASFRPQISSNEKGLLLGFELISTQVNAEDVGPSLEVTVGDIGPQAAATVRWIFTSSLQGEFVDFSATLRHLNEMSNARASLIHRVETHQLEHVVRATHPLAEGTPEFLVNSYPNLQDFPDTLYRSNGTVDSVVVLTDVTTRGLMTDTNLQVQVVLPASVERWVYVRLDDPAPDERFRLLQVIRSDGEEVRLGDNAWTTRRTIHTPGEEPVRERRLHLFDRDSTGSYTLIYGYAAPAITSLDPPALVAGGSAFTLTVNGAGFVSDSTVQWNGADRATTYVSPTQLRAQIPASDIAAPRSAQITVTNPAESGGASRPATLVINAAPEMDTTPPTSAVLPLFEQTSDPSFTVFWAGADEANGSGLKDFDIFVAEEDGPYTPWLSGVTRTSATYTGNYGRTYRFYSIARDNAGNVEATPGAPDATTRVSPEPRNPVPVLRSLDPSSVAAGGPEFVLTVNGADFAPGAIVQWNGQPRPTTFVSSTQLTAAIAADDIVAAGPASVTVSNPAPGGGTSEALAFSVLPATGATPVLQVTAAVARRVGSDLLVEITLVNSGAGDATHVRITNTARLNEVPVTSTLLDLGTLGANGGTSTIALTFPGTAADAGSRVTLHVDGTSDQGTFTGSRRVNVP